MALVVLGFMIWCVVSVVIDPILSSIVEERRWRGEMVAEASSLTTLIARRQAIVQELDEINGDRKRGLLLWKRGSDVSLAANVEALVRSYIPPDGQAMSVSSEAPFAEKGLRHIGIHMDMAMSIPGMTSFLEHVEEAKPKLFIVRLSVTAPPVSDPDKPPRVSLDCDIAAFAETGTAR